MRDGHEQSRASPGNERRQRCAICSRRLGRQHWYLEEAGDEHEPQRSWLLCEHCHAAVQHEMQRAGLRMPQRLSIAIGVVASEHASRPRVSHPSSWEQLGDRELERLLLWSFLVAFAVHALAFILVTAYIMTSH
ncbi:MAG TPA: hypothetical protein VF510_10560 [Ktedonobacterales bacterium]